uniref:SulP family inorganic anion transporter n=1 Tax=Thalassoroseus pseudoceratinae TaxID=2713176 RepID=UPI00141F855E|nr:SulP family inorganic anion transporter [Thalassoroseus pseudoceratinae]
MNDDESIPRPSELPSPASPAWKTDILASVVVFLVALPLCMGIAIASGVPVAAGLVTGIVGGIVVGMLAGAPLQVSGPAAGLTVIVYDLVQKHGLETLGIVVLLAGGLQLLAGVLRLGQWFRAVAPAVIKGMLAGIGVLIFASQFHVMVDDSPKGSGLQNLMAIPQAIAKGLPWPTLHPREERVFRTQHLKELGILHAEQVDLHEAVGEVVPELAFTQIENGNIDPAQLKITEAGFKELIPRQQAINEKLDRLSQELDEWEVTHGTDQKATRVHKAVVAAQEANDAALADLQKNRVLNVRGSQQAADDTILQLEQSVTNHDWAAKIGVLTILIIIVWNMIASKSARLKLVPGPLLAISIVTAVAAWLQLPVLYVEIPDQLLESLHIPSGTVFQNTDISAIFTAAMVIALVASAETLLCAVAVDQMVVGVRTDYNKELRAQGVGNMVCGLFGALPMTGVIVRSAANVQAGGRTRWSAVLHGVWLLVFIVGLAFVLRLIPTAALAGMLVHIGYKLVNPGGIKKLAEYGKGEVLIYFATLVTIVCFDLLSGVIVGIVISAIKLLLNFSRLETDLNLESETYAVLTLSGAATFLRLPTFARELERVPNGAELHVQFERLTFIDHACLELMQNWAKQHETTGGSIQIDWDQLYARYTRQSESSVQTVQH